MCNAYHEAYLYMLGSLITYAEKHLYRCMLHTIVLQRHVPLGRTACNNSHLLVLNESRLYIIEESSRLWVRSGIHDALFTR